MPVDPVITARLGSVTDEVPLGTALQDLTARYRIPEVNIEERVIDGPRGPIRIRLYRPIGAESAAHPGLLWLHGGGWARGDLDMPEAHVVAAELAADPGVVVASVDYRLATETSRYPVPLDDVHASWRWFTNATAELGADPGRLAIGGCSAGANLAAGAAARARDEAEAAPSALLPGNGVVDGLPPTYLVLSEIDDLRASGELFARQLQERGIAVTTLIARGMLHGHLNLPPVDELPEVRRSIDFLATALATLTTRAPK